MIILPVVVSLEESLVEVVEHSSLFAVSLTTDTEQVLLAMAAPEPPCRQRFSQSRGSDNRPPSPMMCKEHFLSTGIRLR